MRSRTLRWLGLLALLFVVAGIAGYGLSIFASSDWAAVVPPLDEPARDKAAVAPAHVNQPVQLATAPRLIVENERAYVNEPIRLGISLEGASGSEFLVITGLAASTRLSAGKPAGPDRWRVSAFDLGILFAYAPKDYVGRMDAVVDLYAANDRKLASQVMRLEWTEMTFAGRADVPAFPDRLPEVQTPVVKPPVLQAPAVTAPVLQPPTVTTPVSQPPAMQSKLPPAEVAGLLQRAQGMLKVGDISAARLVLRRAAEAGNAEAAFLLATTYDPIALRELGVIGFAPDLEQARSWYQRAAALGSGEAERRIERLAGR